MRDAIPHPRVPVAVEQALDQTRVAGAVFIRVEALLVAGVIGAAIGIDVACDDQIFAIGRYDLAGGFSGKMRDLYRVGAIGVDAPDLRSAVLRAGIEDALAIRRPAW